jgi:hypothetical protein
MEGFRYGMYSPPPASVIRLVAGLAASYALLGSLKSVARSWPKRKVADNPISVVSEGFV